MYCFYENEDDDNNDDDDDNDYGDDDDKYADDDDNEPLKIVMIIKGEDGSNANLQMD